MGCFRYIIVNTPHKGDKTDSNNDDNDVYTVAIKNPMYPTYIRSNDCLYRPSAHFIIT